MMVSQNDLDKIFECAASIGELHGRIKELRRENESLRKKNEKLKRKLATRYTGGYQPIDDGRPVVPPSTE